MKLVVLGCWAPYPAPNQACSGYLLEIAGRRILVDLGHGAFGKLQHILDFSKLDAVFISHLHPDHCADLSCLRHAILSANRLGRELRLPVFVPNDPPEKFEVLAGFEDAFEVYTISTESREPLEIAGIGCEIFKTNHPIPTYGLVVQGDGTKFVYTSDTGWEAELVDISRGADILLCEGSLLTADSHLAGKGHLTGEQAGKLALEAGAGMLVLTHFWPGYNLQDLQQEVSSVFPGKFELAGEFRAYIQN
jgi:ribonuclease BN (tRNA processing enzyme)